MLRLKRHERISTENRRFRTKGACSLLTQTFRWKGRPHQPFFSQKTRLSDLSCGVKIWTDRSSILSQSNPRVCQTDKRTDSFLVARRRCTQCMQRGNKTLQHLLAPVHILCTCCRLIVILCRCAYLAIGNLTV